MVDAHFRDTFAHGFSIAEVTILGPVNAYLDTARCLLVFQVREPGIEDFRGQDGLHERSVFFGIRLVNPY